MASDYFKSLYKQYEELVTKLEKQDKTIKETNELVKTLNATIKSLNEVIEEQAKEILRLKNKSDKDSSNSNKPSSWC